MAAKINVWIIEDRKDYRDTIQGYLNNLSDMTCPKAFEDCESALVFLTYYDGQAKNWEKPDVVLLMFDFPMQR